MPTSRSATPISPTGVSEDEIRAILARLGIAPAVDLPDSNDPAVVAATKARYRAKKPIAQYMTSPDSRLGQLYAQYYNLKPQLDALTPAVKESSDAIKSELSAQNPHPQVIPMTTQLYCAGRSDGLAMIPMPAKKTDWDRLKAERPDVMAVIARYTREVTEWQLRRIKAS